MRPVVGEGPLRVSVCVCGCLRAFVSMFVYACGSVLGVIACMSCLLASARKGATPDNSGLKPFWPIFRQGDHLCVLSDLALAAPEFAYQPPALSIRGIIIILLAAPEVAFQPPAPAK